MYWKRRDWIAVLLLLAAALLFCAGLPLARQGVPSGQSLSRC